MLTRTGLSVKITRHTCNFWLVSCLLLLSINLLSNIFWFNNSLNMVTVWLPLFAMQKFFVLSKFLCLQALWSEPRPNSKHWITFLLITVSTGYSQTRSYRVYLLAQNRFMAMLTVQEFKKWHTFCWTRLKLLSSVYFHFICLFLRSILYNIIQRLQHFN